MNTLKEVKRNVAVRYVGYLSLIVLWVSTIICIITGHWSILTIALPFTVTAVYVSIALKLEGYKKDLDDLRTFMYRDFINLAEQYKRLDHDTRLGKFKERYKDLLEPLVEPCKAAEQNPDFDVYDQIFSDYDENTDENKMEEGEYVAQVVASLTEQLDALKVALSVDKVEVKSDENGETVNSSQFSLK